MAEGGREKRRGFSSLRRSTSFSRRGGFPRQYNKRFFHSIKGLNQWSRADLVLEGEGIESGHEVLSLVEYSRSLYGDAALAEAPGSVGCASDPGRGWLERGIVL